MGAGQIGGVATLLDLDFKNAAEFIGEIAEPSEAQYVVHYLSHAMMFCLGAIIEAHVILTPASCVFGERYKFEVTAGTHSFLEYAGIHRPVHHVCTHKGYNHSKRWEECSSDNMALLIINQQFSFHQRETGSDYPVNRIRYGFGAPKDSQRIGDTTCEYYGWGSRRNSYLIPLLIYLRRASALILPQEMCHEMWNVEHNYLCIQKPTCMNEKFGALCPDDLGSILVCHGYIQGMMISRLVDRPCGVGFVDMGKYNKFLTCGVDDSRDVIDHDSFMAFDFKADPSTSTVIVPPPLKDHDTINRTFL